MIEAIVKQNDSVIMHRKFDDPTLGLQHVRAQVEAYIRAENLHHLAECHLVVRFEDLSVGNAPWGAR